MARAARSTVVIQNLVVIFDSSQLSWQYAERIMYRSPLEQAELLAALVTVFRHLHLKHHGDALHEEDEAEDRYEQLLMYDNRRDGYDSADRKRTCIAHEYLCRIGIVPQEANQRTNERAEEYHKFL